MNKLELEKELKNLGKNQKVSVVQLNDGSYGYAFRFYTWTFEKITGYVTKRGFHYNAKEEGKETRMWQAWLSDQVRTSKLLLPTLLEDQDIILFCPKSMNASQANEFAKRVDSLVLNYTKKWSRRELLEGTKGANRLGSEVYEISDEDWKNQVHSAYCDACIEFKSIPVAKQSTRWKAQGNAQIETVMALSDFISSLRIKGWIDLPPATGKTLIPMFTLEEGFQNNTISKRGISILAAPWQSLCDKNATEAGEMTRDNELDIVHIVYHSGAHDKNRKKFTTALQDSSREELYASEINFHLERGKHVVIHVCFDSYNVLQNSLSLCNIDSIQTLWIDEVHKMVSTRATSLNSMIRNINTQSIPVLNMISMTGTVDKHSLDSTYDEGHGNYSMSNVELFGEPIKRITYGQTVLEKLNLPFNVKGFNRYHTNDDYVSGIKLDVLKDSIGENLLNSVLSNINTMSKGHNVILSHFRINNEALTVAEQLKEIQNKTGLFKDYTIKCLTTVQENDPKRRNRILKDIHKDNKKYIVLLGPWAITGSNCQRADAVVWNYVPQSYITIVQGSLRAARMLRNPDHSINEAKKMFTVYFTMTEDNLKDNTFAEALEALHSFQYSGNERTYEAIGELMEDGDGFFSTDPNTLGEPVLDIMNDLPAEEDTINAILERRLQDLLRDVNSIEFSSDWNISKPLYEKRVEQLKKAFLKYSFA